MGQANSSYNYVAKSSLFYSLDCSSADPTHLGPSTIGQPKLVNQLVHPSPLLLPGHMERQAQGSREVEILLDGKGSHDYVILYKKEKRWEAETGEGRESQIVKGRCKTTQTLHHTEKKSNHKGTHKSTSYHTCPLVRCEYQGSYFVVTRYFERFTAKQQTAYLKVDK